MEILAASQQRSCAPLQRLPVEMLIAVFNEVNDPPSLLSAALTSRALTASALHSRQTSASQYLVLFDEHMQLASPPSLAGIDGDGATTALQQEHEQSEDLHKPDPRPAALHAALVSASYPKSEELMLWHEHYATIQATRTRAKSLGHIDGVAGVFRLPQGVPHGRGKSVGYWYMYYKGLLGRKGDCSLRRKIRG